MQHQTFKKPDIMPYFYSKTWGMSQCDIKGKKEGNVITKVGLRLSYIKSHEVKLNIEKSWAAENVTQQLLFVCGNR